MVGHPVLDAAGHIHVLGFGVDDALAAVESKVDREQRSVADQSLETFEALGIGINCRFCNCHWPSLPSGQTYEGNGITVQTPGRRTNGRVLAGETCVLRKFSRARAEDCAEKHPC